MAAAHVDDPGRADRTTLDEHARPLEQSLRAHSRRHVTEMLQVEKARALRHKETFCLALLDLDRFKAINDRHGHAVGDKVLKTFAQTVLSQIRASDHFGRYGGEEFMLILSHTPLAAALPIMERIRANTQKHRWSAIADGLVVTVSIGIDEYAPLDESHDLIKRADAALYRAKAQGRDRVAHA